MSAISVIIPTYNRASTIARAVSSALSQCRDDDEIIVIDDGSTDGTEEVLQRFGDKILYHYAPNGGAGYARNIGLQKAKNELIAFLDSDDEWMPEKLSLQRQLMDARPELAFCFSELATRYSDGREQRRSLSQHYGVENIGDTFLGCGVPLSTLLPTATLWNHVKVHIGSLYRTQMEFVCVQVNTTMVRRSIIADRLFFPEDITYHEDWEFFSRLSKLGPVAYIDTETAWIYFHHLSQLTDTAMTNIHIARLKVLDRVWGQDRNFISTYKKDFINRKKAEQIKTFREFLRKKMYKEIKSLLSDIDNPPRKFLLVKYLPIPILHPLLSLRQRLIAIRS